MVKAGTYRYKLSALMQALDSYGKSLEIDLSGKDVTEADAIKNGQALKFGYSVELLWKTAKAFLREEHGIECNSPKSCIRYLFQNTKLNEEDGNQLLRMIDQRNELAQIYDQELFEEIWNSLGPNLELMKKAANLMSDKPDAPENQRLI